MSAAAGHAGSSPQPGQRIGRYELVAQMASGGMATVYLARATGQGGFDRLFAIKCIHPRFARDRGFIEMFLDEARIASRISHPNVCGVFDVGEEGGVYYLAMEYLHGESVATLLKALAGRPEERVSPRYHVHACAIVAAAAEGLHAAHELRGDRGEPLDVVHRDISPHNIFITYDGNVRVVDFGIARAAGRLHKTLSGVVKGKVAYMAPEQLENEDVDRRADVWALGVTLWELLTLRRLFRKDHPIKTMMAVREEVVRPPSLLAPHVGPELDAIVQRALSRDPEGRQATARELSRELRRYVATRAELVGTAELGEWMDELFAEQREEKRALIEHARLGGQAATAPPTERMERPPADAVATEVGAPESSTVRPSTTGSSRSDGFGSAAAPVEPLVAGGVPRPSDVPTVSGRGPGPSRAVVPARLGHPTLTESVVLPVGRGRGLAVVIALGAALLVGGGVLAWFLASSGEAPAMTGEPPADTVADTAASSGRPAPPAAPPAGVPVAPASRVRASGSPAPVNGVATGEPTPVTPTGGSAGSRNVGSRSAGRSRPSDMGGPAPRPHGGQTAPPGPVEPAPAPSPAPPLVAPPVPEPEAPPPPPPPTPAAPGVVSVGLSGGWGDILVDGRPHGQTPARLTLPAGRHQIAVRPFGEGPPLSRSVEVPPGGSVNVRFEAAP